MDLFHIFGFRCIKKDLKISHDFIPGGGRCHQCGRSQVISMEWIELAIYRWSFNFLSDQFKIEETYVRQSKEEVCCNLHHG